MFDRYNDPKLDEFEARIKAATTNEEKVAITKEAMQYVTEQGATVPVDSLEAVVSFATGVVDQVLQSIIATAHELRSDSVPVEFLEQLRPELPGFISQKMFKTVEELGVPLGFAGGVPDDLSGLEL